MNILGIDYGTKRIGVAVATGPLATPLGIITNTVKSQTADVVSDHVINEILSLINEYAIERIVVGISEGAMAEKSRAFIQALASKTTIPIEEIDETLSSVQAGEYQQSMKKSKRKGDRDHLAAAVILQDYLDLA